MPKGLKQNNISEISINSNQSLINNEEINNDINNEITNEITNTDQELNNEIIEQAFNGLQNNIQVFKMLCEKKNKKEFNFEDINVTSQKLNDILNGIEVLSKLSTTIVKYQQKIIQKRSFFKKRDNTNSEPRKPSGFTKPMDVPSKFIDFYNKHILPSTQEELKAKYIDNFNINDQHPRTTLTGIIFAYIRAKELYSSVPGEKINKRLIKLDIPLKELFNVQDGDINGFKDFQKHMGSLYV